MNEKRCILCDRAYEYDKYKLFGRGCLSNLYELLGLEKTLRGTKDKEMYLCNKIAHRNFKFFLSKKKKYKLAEKYIALKYLDKINFNKYSYDMPKESKDIDYNSFLDDIKDKISKDRKKISIFYKETADSIVFRLNDVYEFFNDTQKFEEMINLIKNKEWGKLDEKVAQQLIEGFSFMFDVTKISNPIFYAGFYTMQYMFWEIVVVGGLLADFKLSAELLRKSLVNLGEESSGKIEIIDEKITSIVINNEEFKNKINELLKKYGNEKIELKEHHVDFVGNDLFLALHGVNINLNGEKQANGTWNLNVELIDKYDFTDFKSLKEYATSTDSILKSIFSTTLNNLGVASSEYGVIRPYEFIMKFEMNNYVVSEEEKE